MKQRGDFGDSGCQRFGRFRGLLVALVVLAGAAPAWTWTADLGLGFSWRNTDAAGFFPWADLKLGYDYQGFAVDLDFLAKTDGLYPVPERQFGSIYFVFKSGGLSYTNGALALRAGVTVQKDITDSPYAMFFSSKGNSDMGMSVKFDDGSFFYETRWLSLNWNSAIYKTKYPVLAVDGTPNGQYVEMPYDRGMNFRTIGLHLGDFRLAYQEATVYTGSAFDPWYFLLPVPAYFTQYVRNAAGAPYQIAQPSGDGANQNYITGLLLDYKSDDWYGVLQILIDDANLNRIIAPDSYQNPDKIGVDLGARYRSEIGRFGLFTAMTTKYTFQPFGAANNNTRYGYYYYPAVETAAATIPRSDNAIGFVNGENNWSIRIEWDNASMAAAWYGLAIQSNLEFTLTGVQSPAKPWGDYNYYSDGGEGARWLDDPVLEKKLVWSARAGIPLSVFSFELAGSVGYVWNELLLDWPVNMTGSMNQLRLYRPSDQSRFIGSLELSAVVHFDQVVAALQTLPVATPATAASGDQATSTSPDSTPATLDGATNQ